MRATEFGLKTKEKKRKMRLSVLIVFPFSSHWEISHWAFGLEGQSHSTPKQELGDATVNNCIHLLVVVSISPSPKSCRAWKDHLV